MRRFPPVILLFLPLFTLRGQGLLKLPADQAGCVDSKNFPKLLECRIDNCEKKDPDHREVSAGEDEKGETITTPLDGISHSVMYECQEGTTPASIVEQAAAALKAKGFEIPYQFADAEASLTARKDDLWITVDAASRFYTLIETAAAPPDFEAATDAESMAEMLERYGHVPVKGIEFMTGRPDLEPSSVLILADVITILKAHPGWRLRVEVHTDNRGAKMENMALSSKRAAALVTWLTLNGIKRTRLESQGMGDTKPIADNLTEPGRIRNRRIELVKIPSLTAQ